MIIYNNNDYGPAIDKDGNPSKCGDGKCECKEPCYKQILDSIHSRRVKILRLDDDNSQIIHQNT